ncbi:LuxR C-terminal-related transcriptional regulator [Streptomyces niveus]|uniref:LuxR C-terminal-related transcriptional regulator n=1 Tax=Streptomyces niveus TaxID=193462 RepID=UPI0036DD0E04
MVRTALRVILEAEPDLTVGGGGAPGGVGGSGGGGVRRALVLWEGGLPEIDGIRATEQILGSPGPCPRVVVVTTFENDSYVYEALRVGASGFLLKRAGAEDLVQAVRLVARSDSLLFPAALRGLAAEYARSRPPAPRWASRLTEREAAVLRLMATGLTNAEIAERLGVGPATVKSHVASVLAKTGVRDRTQAVIAAYESGFISPR